VLLQDFRHPTGRLSGGKTYFVAARCLVETHYESKMTGSAGKWSGLAASCVGEDEVSMRCLVPGWS
jgi:hypothetical protein